MEMYLAYLDFTLVLAKTPSLFDVLLQLGVEYIPNQKESIFSLIKQACSLAEIFLSCLIANETVESKVEAKEAELPKKLAEKFVEVFNFLKLKIEDKQK